METIRDTQKKYCSLALRFAIFAGFGFYLAGMVPICKGLILGSLFSILNFIIMGETLPMRILKSKGRAFFAALSSICFRYLLLGIPIYLAIKQDQFNLFAVVFGIFMVQLILLAHHVFGAFISRFQKQV